jgi:hypothetical protein
MKRRRRKRSDIKPSKKHKETKRNGEAKKQVKGKKHY